MLKKLIFLVHETVIQNDPGKETLSAGLGPIWQYGIVLLVLIIAGIVYLIKKRKKNVHEDILKVKTKKEPKIKKD